MWAQQRCQLSAGGIWDWNAGMHSYLFRITAALSASLALVWFEQPLRRFIRRGLLFKKCSARKKKVKLGLTLSSRETKKYDSCWKLKYVSQFPSCLSLTNDPSSWAGNMGLSQFRRQQIYVISLQWQPWNLCGEITAAACRRGADWCHSTAVTKHVSPVLWTSTQRSCTNEDPCHTWQPLTAIASPLHLCRMCKYIKLKANFALFLLGKKKEKSNL